MVKTFLHTMKNLYSGPRPDLKSVVSLNPHKVEPVILSSKKPVLVIATVSLTEDNEYEDGDIEESIHEFDTVSEAKEFSKAKRDPDKNPVETRILEFRNLKWELIEHLETSL
jgi:hypothetical protein